MQAIPSIEGLQSQISRVQGMRDNVQSRLEETKSRVKELENEGALLDLVSGLFRKLIDQEVTIGVQAVEKLQTEGLQAVFEDQDIQVKADVQVQRGKVSVDLVTQQHHPNGMVVEGLSNDALLESDLVELVRIVGNPAFKAF